MRQLIGWPLLAAAVVVSLPVAARVEPGELIPVDGEGAKYWSRWRGPSGQGAVVGTNYVDTWSDTTNVKWKVPVPGIGHSSPIVWKDHIFLTTARDDGAKLAMLAFNRATGKLLWETPVPTPYVEHVYPKNSRASATATTDGTLVYASFGAHGMAAFDFSGKMAWHKKIADVANTHGTAGSPVLYKDRLFIYQDNDNGSWVAAVSAKTGDVLWRTPRQQTVGWGTPVVVRVGTRDELVVSGQRRVMAYDTESGKELWSVAGMGFEVIPTPVIGHGLVFCSSGRQGPTIAIRPGGSGDVTTTHVAWSTPRGSPFVPSTLLHGDLLYMVNDIQSILTVFDAKSGKTMYQDRLGEAIKEGFSSSPVAVGDKLFFTNDYGQTFVVQAGPTFKLLHVNEMKAQVIASPALVDGTWYWRTDSALVAIGAK